MNADRTSRGALTRPDGHWASPSLAQAVELATGSLPREFLTEDELTKGARELYESGQAWPSPTARDWKNPGSAEGYDRRVDDGHRQPLGETVAQWPTPAASDHDRQGNYPRGNPTLPEAGKNWLTPTSLPTPQEGQRYNQAGQNGLGVQVSQWPTPNTSDSSRAGNHGKGDPTLAGAVKPEVWPTPAAAQARQGQSEPDGRRGQTLTGAANGQEWRTPKASEAEHSGRVAERKEGQSLGLAVQANGWEEPNPEEWGTPTASFFAGRGAVSPEVWEARMQEREAKGLGRFSTPLHVQAEVAETPGWPTPQARDAKNPDRPESGNYQRKVEAGWSIDLGSAAPAWPTPAASEVRQGYQQRPEGMASEQNQQSLTTKAIDYLSSPPDPEIVISGPESSPADPISPPLSETRKRLNPNFVGWMMGLPDRWLDALSSCGPEEMALYLYRLRMRLVLLLNAQGYRYAIPSWDIPAIETPTDQPSPPELIAAIKDWEDYLSTPRELIEIGGEAVEVVGFTLQRGTIETPPTMNDYPSEEEIEEQLDRITEEVAEVVLDIMAEPPRLSPPTIIIPEKRQNYEGMMTSLNPNWRTERAAFDWWDRRYFFDVDAAASPHNALLPYYFSEEGHDALTVRWIEHGNRFFLNPMYGRTEAACAPGCKRLTCAKRGYHLTREKPGIEKFVAAAREAAKDGATVVMLVPARTDTAWWHEHVMTATEIHLVSGRVHFVDDDGNTGPAPFPSAFVVIESYWHGGKATLHAWDRQAALREIGTQRGS